VRSRPNTCGFMEGIEVGSIHGAKRMLKYKKFEASKRPPSKAAGAFLGRNRMLPSIGYATYQEYLKSDDWKRLRGKKLKRHPLCVVCESAATEVHHRDYRPETMLGLSWTSLVTLCRSCHESIEFDGERKRTLKEANTKLVALAHEAGRQTWLHSIKDGDLALRRRRA
jgi:5-methylcytosine-specific restriction endonuclease McrA